MSGEQESKTQKTDERRGKVLKLLQEYPIELGIGNLQPTNEVQKFVNIPKSDIHRLTAEECGEGAVILAQSATYIQLEVNKMQSDLNWCTRYINFLIAGTIAECGHKYTPAEYKRSIAIRQNDVASKLQSIISNLQVRIDEMAYMPNQLRGLATFYSDLQQTKRSQRS